MVLSSSWNHYCKMLEFINCYSWVHGHTYHIKNHSKLYSLCTSHDRTQTGYTNDVRDSIPHSQCAIHCPSNASSVVGSVLLQSDHTRKGGPDVSYLWRMYKFTQDHTKKERNVVGIIIIMKKDNDEFVVVVELGEEFCGV